MSKQKNSVANRPRHMAGTQAQGLTVVKLNAPFRQIFPKKEMKTVKDARKLLGRLTAAFLRGDVASDTAKTLAYLAGAFIQAAHTADLEEKLNELEDRLNGRREKW